MSLPPADTVLSSPQNAYVKGLVELRKDGNERRRRQRFLLEGARAVDAALDLDHVSLHEIVWCDKLFEQAEALLEKAARRKVPVVRVSKDVFKKIADVKTPQGIAAVAAMLHWTLDDLLAKPDPLIVVACGLQDPGNLGTLIRSCDAAGAAGLIALDGTADAYNAKVVRATAAGLLALPLVRMSEREFLAAAAERGLRLAATSSHRGVSYRAFDWGARPLALCIGNEGQGLSEAVAAACTDHVTIPLRGQAESLNAGVAASILIFEAQK